MTKCYLIASSLLQVSSMGLSATPIGGPCLSGNVSLTQVFSYYIVQFLTQGECSVGLFTTESELNSLHSSSALPLQMEKLRHSGTPHTPSHPRCCAEGRLLLTSSRQVEQATLIQ